MTDPGAPRNKGRPLMKNLRRTKFMSQQVEAPEPHQMIASELSARKLSATPQAMQALVHASQAAAPEVVGDSDSLLLGLITAGSYTIDFLRDAGANVKAVSAKTDATAGGYYSPVDPERLDRIKSLFSEKSTFASLLDREEFDERPIEAADILQHAVAPITESYAEGEWVFHYISETSRDSRKIRIHSDIELLMMEVLSFMFAELWGEPEKYLANRLTPLTRAEVMKLGKIFELAGEDLRCTVRAINRYLTQRELPADDPHFVKLAVEYQYTPTLAAENFMSNGGNYRDLAVSLQMAARWAPERDQPVLVLFDQDGRISVKNFTYRGSTGLSDEGANQIISVSAPSNISLIHTSVLDEFEELVNNPAIRELQIQKFLEKFPEILYSLGYTECRSQVILSEPGKQDLIPDFILQKPGGNGFDILDLKLPRANIVAGTPYARPSHEITKAIAQLRAYRNFFQSQLNRSRFRQIHKIDYLEPRLIVTIGRSGQYLDTQMREDIEAQVCGVRILTYDELLAYGRSRAISLDNRGFSHQTYQGRSRGAN